MATKSKSAGTQPKRKQSNRSAAFKSTTTTTSTSQSQEDRMESIKSIISNILRGHIPKDNPTQAILELCCAMTTSEKHLAASALSKHIDMLRSQHGIPISEAMKTDVLNLIRTHRNDVRASLPEWVKSVKAPGVGGDQGEGVLESVGKGEMRITEGYAEAWLGVIDGMMEGEKNF